MNPDKSAPKGEIILIHTVCNKSYQRPSADGKADDIHCEQLEKS